MCLLRGFAVNSCRCVWINLSCKDIHKYKGIVNNLETIGYPTSYLVLEIDKLCPVIIIAETDLKILLNKLVKLVIAASQEIFLPRGESTWCCCF